MTDFRRPDLDLWEEEDDGEDQRPTIVSERPPAPAGLPPLARMSLVQRLIAKGELEDSWELRAALAAQRQHASAKAASASMPPAARASQAPASLSPMEAAARQAADGRASTEILDEHELDMLRLSEPPSTAAFERAAAALDHATATALESATSLSAPLPQVARPAQLAGQHQRAAEEPHEALLVRPRTQPGAPRPDVNAEAHARAGEPGSEVAAEPTVKERVAFAEPAALLRAAELADDARLRQHPQMSEEDFVPTRLARRSRAPVAQRRPPEILETPVFRDREITERISVPPLASSLAPAARTVRPHLRAQKGMGGWQLALVAMLLIGAGLGVARLRRESAAAALTARVRSAVSAALEPSSAAEVMAQPAQQPAEPAPPTSAAAPEPSVLPELAAVEPAPAPVQPEPAAEARAARKARTAQEPSGRAKAAEETPAAKAESAQAREPAAAPARESSEPPGRAAGDAPGASDLPPQPSRDDVRAALRAVVPDLQKCTGSMHGTAEVTMTVRSAGVVSYAVVAGSFAGTPEGSCIARTVKLAKFPAFSEPSVRVSYPFEL